MRNKIIAVNAAIIAIVGLLSFVLMRTSITTAAAPTSQLLGEAKRDAQSASARVQLDGLRAERWLAAKSSEPATLDALNKAVPSAAGEAATALCDSVVAASKTYAAFDGGTPSLVLLVGASGKILGRNASNLLRGDDVSAAYPFLKEVLSKGGSGSDLWINASRNDQYLASYAAVRDDKGQIVGALVAGFTINDELSRVAESTTGRPIVVVRSGGGAPQVVARSSANAVALDGAVAGEAKASVTSVLDTGHATALATADLLVAAAPLEGFGGGHSSAIVVAAPSTTIENAAALATPLLFVSLLGVLLVIVAGSLLGSYITRPIGILEEGLLAILNGQSERRFNLDHAELGGVAFRIDQLLNELMGVEEDSTDEQGRLSRAPAAPSYSAEADAGASASNEPADGNYSRLFAEYIAAKQSLGEPTDHITEPTFVARIQSMEQEAAANQGKKVRFEVRVDGKEVKLQPVDAG
jgi:hypothetical protein